MVSPASRMLRAISLGVFCRLGPLDQGDHAVDEALARLGGDPHDDAVGQHPGAAGDRRAVAARLADDRRRFAGDGRLVHRGDALDDVAVTGDQTRPGCTTHEVADLQVDRRHLHGRCRRPGGRGRRSRERVLRSVSAWALPRPSATASAKLANSTVNHSQIATSPANTLLARRAPWAGRRKNSTVVQHGADQHDEHDRVAGLGAGVELDERVDDAPGGRWPARTAGAGLRSRRRRRDAPARRGRTTVRGVSVDMPFRSPRSGRRGARRSDRGRRLRSRSGRRGSRSLPAAGRGTGGCRCGRCRRWPGTGCLRTSDPPMASTAMIGM